MKNATRKLSKEQIEANIAQAVVDEVAEFGIGSASVGAIAKRAKVSPGTIYLHFENKDDMLQQIYLQIKTEFHSIMVAAADELSSESMIKRMWFDLFKFASDHPNYFLFIEHTGAAQVLTKEQSNSIAYMVGDITEMITRAIDDKTLAPLPVQTHIVMLVGPALHMARTAILNGRIPDFAEINLTFDRVWLSIKAEC